MGGATIVCERGAKTTFADVYEIGKVIRRLKRMIKNDC